MSNLALHSAGRWCYKHNLKLLARIFTRLNRMVNACDIPYTADIHPSVEFAHRGLGVVVGHDTVIGEGSKIESNVTIGGRKGIRANPVLGNNVLVGTGAVILGAVKIGNDAQIGAGAVVISDVPSGFTAVGVPAKCIQPKKEGTNDL